jgi:VanZ family protein
MKEVAIDNKIIKKIFSLFSFEIRLLISALYLGIIVLLSLLPIDDFPKVPLFPGADKLIHMMMYFLFSLLALWTFHVKTNIERWKLYLFIIGWGVFMEFLQITMRLGRHFSLLDICANISGVILGIALYKFVISKLKI